MAGIEESIKDSLINSFLAENPDVNVMTDDMITGLIENFEQNKKPVDKLTKRAKTLSGYKSVQIDDAPEGLQGMDKVNWMKENNIDPITGQSLGQYMESQELGDSFGEYYKANEQFNNNIKGYSMSLRDDIRNFSGTKLDLLKLSHNNKAIRDFLGVSEEETLHWLNRFSELEDAYKRVDRNQSDFAQGAAKREIYRLSNWRNEFHNFLYNMGYGEYMDINKQLGERGEQWELGLE